MGTVTAPAARATTRTQAGRGVRATICRSLRRYSPRPPKLDDQNGTVAKVTGGASSNNWIVQAAAAA